MEHTSNNHYWGGGEDGSGEKCLGNLLMETEVETRESMSPIMTKRSCQFW